jgi:predicted secreted acid phosphatase
MEYIILPNESYKWEFIIAEAEEKLRKKNNNNESALGGL